MTAKRLVFWFDFASTYSYLSAERIDALCAEAGVEVEWRPILLGPVFKAQGWDTSPFNIYPAKGRYMWRDMERLCAARGLPLVRPDPFPQNSLLAARTARVSQPTGADPAFCKAVFRAEFQSGAQISDPEVITRLLSECGLPSDLLEVGQSNANKAALRADVEKGMALGLFGAPTFTVAEEVFWGDDRLEAAIRFAVA